MGYVARFRVLKSFMDRYPIHQVGTGHHTEWWVPAEECGMKVRSMSWNVLSMPPLLRSREEVKRSGLKSVIRGEIMAIVDRHGLPLAVSAHAANHHEVTLMQQSFDFYMIEAKPDNLIGDRAYDSDKLDEELRQEGIEMISPYRKNRKKPKTQDGRKLRRYERRWLAERSLLGYSGNVASWLVGNAMPRISSALCS